MNALFKLLLAGAALCAPAVAAPSRRAACDPIPPKQDPWYTAPAGFENAAPGTILRVRPVAGNLTTVAGNCAAAYNILYRTTNSLNAATWAVTTVFVPESPINALLSYQIYYDSADLNASPSYAMYADMPADIQTSLGKGWFVSVPDYEGPLASFSAGLLSGHATLDAVRAVLAANGSTLSLPDGTKYAMWGYSGGALASEWAAELQAQYAPELSFSGAALGGLTPNATSVMLTISGTLETGIGIASILGLLSQYPDVNETVTAKLKTTGDYTITEFMAALDMDLDESVAAYAYQDISAYFVDGFADIFSPATESIIYNDGMMGHTGVPAFPIFAYKAIEDGISPVADTDKLIEQFCDQGANILYHRNTIGGHIADEYNGHPAAEAWLDSVLAGTYAANYATTGCTILDMSVNVTSSPY